MPAPAERMRQMRERRRKRGLRELRIVLPDPRLTSVRRRVAAQIARLIPGSEDEALSWIEAVSEFDSPDRQADDEARRPRYSGRSRRLWNTSTAGNRTAAWVSGAECLCRDLPTHPGIGRGAGFSHHDRSERDKWPEGAIPDHGRQAGDRSESEDWTVHWPPQ